VTGKHGPQAGGQRHLTREKTLAALNLVRSGETIPLNLPLDAPPLVDPPRGRPGLKHIARMHNEVRPIANGRFNVVNDDIVELSLQASTHWDALAHWGVIEPGTEGVFFGGAGLSETFPEFGAKTLGIDALAGGIVTRGVLLDFVRLLEGDGAAYLQNGHNIGLADVEACLATYGIELQPGDAVLSYTGFQHRLDAGDRERWRAGAPDITSPGLLADTLPIWEAADVFALVSDNPSVEPVPMGEGDLHAGALKQLGIYLGELWALDTLADRCREDGRYDFALVSIPLNLPGAFGSPANALALR